MGSEAKMAAKFDIFERLADGHPIWIQSFDNLEQAHDRLKQLARDADGDCFIYSEEKGIVEFAHGERATEMVERGTVKRAWSDIT